MFFVSIGKFNDITRADAIACAYAEATLSHNQTLKAWQFRCFTTYSEEAKTARFWLDNKDSLEEAIAAKGGSYEFKRIDQLTTSDQQALESIKFFSTCYELDAIYREAIAA